MALDATNFKTMVGGAQQVHHYHTADTAVTAAGSGYFNDITNRLKQWDIIIVVGATGSTPTVDVLVVTSATGAATVTTTNGT